MSKIANTGFQKHWRAQEFPKHCTFFEFLYASRASLAHGCKLSDAAVLENDRDLWLTENTLSAVVMDVHHGIKGPWRTMRECLFQNTRPLPQFITLANNVRKWRVQHSDQEKGPCLTHVDTRLYANSNESNKEETNNTLPSLNIPRDSVPSN